MVGHAEVSEGAEIKVEEAGLREVTVDTEDGYGAVV